MKAVETVGETETECVVGKFCRCIAVHALRRIANNRCPLPICGGVGLLGVWAYKRRACLLPACISFSPPTSVLFLCLVLRRETVERHCAPVAISPDLTACRAGASAVAFRCCTVWNNEKKSLPVIITATLAVLPLRSWGGNTN